MSLHSRICILLIVINSYMTHGQGCIIYPEIEGAFCVACTPEGWIATSSSPDIYDPTAGPCNTSESPSGGNAIHLFSNGSSDIEGVATSIVIDDFVEGSQYYFDLYALTCLSNSVELEIEIDGELYTFDTEDDWQLFSICVVPNGPEFDINITVAPYSGGSITSTLIDSGECMPNFCCSLNAAIEEEFIVICPGEEMVIMSEYENEIGNVDVEWTSDPSDGVNYLDDPTIINPTILVEDTEDFEGGSYVFTMTVTDEECFVVREVEIEIRPSLLPIFEIYLCEINEDQLLPTTSYNGFTGSWTGNFNFDQLGGTIQEYVFTLDPGQDNCIEVWTFEYEIHLEEIITFELDSRFCVDDDKRYRLPDKSEEGVSGEWYDHRFSPEELGIGTFEFIFIPDNTEFCAREFLLQIEVVDLDSIIFDLPSSFCSDDSLFVLPSQSLSGIAGTWGSPYIDLSIIGNFQLPFVPSEDPACFLDYTYNFEVYQEISNTFNISDTICRESLFINLDSMSLEGNLGYWNPQQINFDTVPNNFTATWIPLESSCSDSLIINVFIQNLETPVFNLPSSLCINSGVFNLPNTSINQIEGTWSVAEIDTDFAIASNIDLQFVPLENHCSDIYLWEIEIVDAIEPIFDLNVSFCQNQSSITLPILSANGVEGTWTVSTIYPSTISDEITSEFYPLSDLSNCYDSTSLTFYILPLDVPTFDLPASFCESGETIIFDELSNNDIPGIWTTPELNTSEFSTSTFTNTFTPLDSECYSSITFDFDLIQFPDFSLSVNSPSSCESSDGRIDIIPNDVSYFYSINNGVNWQTNNFFNNLPSGSYNISIQSVINLFCVENLEAELLSPGGPEIIDIIITQASSCTDINASLQVVATGLNLEYSIDGGVSWQTNNVFNGLQAGVYEAIVRSQNSIACTDMAKVTIIEFPPTLIQDVAVTQVSDCQTEDGAIQITASGQNLEYSITNGMNWQEDMEFFDLPPGIYNLIVRSKDAIDCFDSVTVELESPTIPMLIEVIITDPSDCAFPNGAIEIIAVGTSLEYSINGGMDWFPDNTFYGLADGNYSLLIRDISQILCLIQENVMLSPVTNIEILSSEITPPADCNSEDGGIKIITNISSPLFSIDNGINWQVNNTLSSLSPGNYTLLISDDTLSNCLLEFQFEIISPDCPCQPLIIEYETSSVNCFDSYSGSISINDISGFFTPEDYQFTWFNGSSELEMTGLSSGWFTYQIQYDKNCSMTDSVYVDHYDPLTFGLLGFDVDCENMGSIEVTNLQGGSGEFLYSLNGMEFQESNIFFNLSAEDYLVYVQDVLGCEDSEAITLNSKLDLSLELPQITSIIQGSSTFLNPLINQLTIDSFVWFPKEGILNPNELIAQVSPSESIEYTLTIFFGQCTETRTVFVEVLPRSTIYTADMFSPNADNNNDHFYIQGPEDSGILINTFQIYDRWGNLVFNKSNPSLNNIDDGWDGRFQNEPAIIGVYVYSLEVEINGKKELRIGSLQLIR